MIETLNNCLEEFVGEDSFYKEEDYKLIQDMISIILSVKVPLKNYKYNSKYELDKSKALSYRFLDSLKSGYSDRLRFIFNEKKIDEIKSNEGELTLSSVDIVNGEKRIQLYYRDTIEDSYTITHEFFHYDNLELDNITNNWHLMTEGISITSELLQKKWMMETGNTPKDYKGNEQDILLALFIKACQLDFELRLIRKYYDQRYLTIYNLIEIFEVMPGYYSDFARIDLEKIKSTGNLSYDLLIRDVIGGCLSSHMIERIYRNKKYIQEFIEIHENCRQMCFLDSLDYLDLDVEDEDAIILSKKSLKELKLEYQSRIKRVY